MRITRRRFYKILESTASQTKSIYRHRKYDEIIPSHYSTIKKHQMKTIENKNKNKSQKYIHS